MKEHYKTSLITCPHCDHVDEDYSEYGDFWEEGEHETKCRVCDEKFTVHTEHEIKFTTGEEE